MPRDIKRIEPFVENLKEYWLRNSDLRFGQMVFNLTSEIPNVIDIFNPEDDEWEKALEKKFGKEYINIKHLSDKCDEIHDGCQDCIYMCKKEEEFPCSCCRGTVLYPDEKIRCYYTKAEPLTKLLEMSYGVAMWHIANAKTPVKDNDITSVVTGIKGRRKIQDVSLEEYKGMWTIDGVYAYGSNEL